MSPDFKIDDRVRMMLSADIEGIVTAYCVREGGKTYEVTWIHNGETKAAWVPASMIRAPYDGEGMPL